MTYWGALFGKPIRITIPPEFANEAALLAYLGLGPNELKKIWYFRARMYRHFSIAKAQNKVRLISAPDERLKFLQHKIAEKLTDLYRPRKQVHGFVAGKSVKTNALAHLGRRFVVNIDLKDFFPTITQKRVAGLLLSLGLDNQVTTLIAHICCNDGNLPQGAPSSPVISNMICFRLDKKLLGIAKEARCVYTRYADDITFSSHQPPTALFEVALPPAGRFSPDLFTPKLLEVFQQNGVAINPNKTHYADRNSRRIVTGLKINELVNVDRRFVRNIRAALHAVEAQGIVEAQKTFQEKYGGSSLVAHLQGKISFLSHIRGQSDPVVRSVTLRFNKCFPKHLIKVTPTPSEIRDRSAWVIEDKNGDVVQGTAFFLKDIGLVTAAHCVEPNTEFQIYHPSKPANKFAVRVKKKCTHRDLALLEHEIPATEFFELARSLNAASQGDQLTAVGYPCFGPGDGVNTRLGTVSSLPVKRDVKLIEVTQTLTQGMSGGPLLDANNGVVGVIHKGGPEEGRNFAIAIEVLSEWIESS
ncbi:MAG: trypsin-like peptidase domain-containing protein [Alphaproteobacteria bacterium]|nr:trypsin-like peptidase domain-containing protein [Alphaproteobacteria bacterium]